jgi:hypothetical protein
MQTTDLYHDIVYVYVGFSLDRLQLTFAKKLLFIIYMCFTERQSYLNFLVLTSASLYLMNKKRLAIPLFYLGLKDLLQGLTYNNLRNNESTTFLTSLSWIHICFQPLMINLFFSHFDSDFKYWNYVFIGCFILGVFALTILHEFDIQQCSKCVQHIHKDNDFCADKTESYIGKIHIGYRFNTNIYENFRFCLYAIAMCVPFFTKAWILNILWIYFIGLIGVFSYFNNIAFGEESAIWCFLSIFASLPVALYSDYVIRLQRSIKFIDFFPPVFSKLLHVKV